MAWQIEQATSTANHSDIRGLYRKRYSADMTVLRREPTQSTIAGPKKRVLFLSHRVGGVLLQAVPASICLLPLLFVFLHYIDFSLVQFLSLKGGRLNVGVWGRAPILNGFIPSSSLNVSLSRPPPAPVADRATPR